jgi:hypothetical protein
MQFAFGGDIGLMRFFWCIKQTYANRSVIDFYFRQPFAVFFANATKAAFVWFSSLILRVLGVCNLAQITPSIVGAVSVYVVYLVRRPFSGLVEPCQTVCEIQRVIQPNDHVAIFGYAAHFLADAATPARKRPCKKPAVRVIARYFFEAIRRHVVNINPVLCGGQA